MPSRRKTLALIGGGTIVAASAASAGFLTTRTPTSALAPWEAAGTYADPRKNALSFALLSPNPHNRQPWLVALQGDDGIRIWRDPALNLPETDPFDRQLTIGMGCFLETLSIAATGTGHTAQITLFPEGEDGPVADIRLVDGATRHPLIDAIPHRRSTKEPYADTPVPQEAVDALAPYATILTAEDDVAALRALTWDAFMIETNTPRTLKESVDLMRFGKAEINATPDGIDLGGPMLETLMLAGIVTRDKQLDPESSGFQAGVDIYLEMLDKTPAYAVLTTLGNSRAEQIEAGRRWLRLNLATTALGLSVQPVSQCLQEFPEMAGPYAQAHAMLAAPGETVQMLGRLGYGPETPPSPRWPLESKLRHA